MSDFNIMIVDDEEAILEGIKDTMTEYPIRTFRSPRAAETALDSSFYDIIVADYKMPDLSGLDFFIRAKQKGAYDYGIHLTAYAYKELLRTFLNQNLINKVVEKPLRIDNLRSVLNEGVSHCMRRKQDERELRDLRERYESMLEKTWFLNDRPIGADRGLKEVVGKAAHMAATTENVLITGETGTGKEVFTRAIHSMGPRKDQPFVKINCGAIPETMIEDELFGHVKGAYSGAYTDKPGRIELADMGTLFLDEIGELKPELQTRLLQVVQEKRIERIGSTKSTPVDFRLLCAMNQDIETMLNTRRLRKDLYYRIATFHIHIPPLRERKEDIPPLLDYLLEKYREEFGRKEITIAQDALEKLLLYEWPGNIRELESVLKRAVSLLDRLKSVITEKDIVPLVTADGSAEGYDPFEPLVDEVLRTGLGIRDIENRVLKGLLSRFNGRVYEASRAMGIPKDRFYRNVKQDKPRLRAGIATRAGAGIFARLHYETGRDTMEAVKKYILFIARMVLTAVLLSAVITAVIAMVLWSLSHNPAFRDTGTPFLELVPRAAKTGAPISVFLTLFLLSYLTYRKRRIIHFMLALVLSCAMVAGSVIGLTYLRVETDESGRPIELFIGTYIHRLEGKTLYVEASEGNEIRSVVVIDSSAEGKRFSFQPRGTVDPGAGEIRFPDGSTVPIAPESPLFSPLFTAAPGVSALLEDISYLSNSLHETWKESLFQFCLYAGSLCLFCVCCSLFAAITNWPVVNLILILCSARFFFFLPRFLSGSMAKAMSKTLTGTEPGTTLLASIFIILSVLLIGWDLLFVNRGRDGQEKTDG